MSKVIVGMSGGIDSTIAAYLLKRQGYNVTGIHLKTWDSLDENGQCSSEQDWKDVQESCSTLAIPCKSLNFSKDYWTMVFTPFLKQLSSSLSPNPDINCNSKIKFGSFLKYCIEKENADYVATGHYARILDLRLFKGIDTKKDQSYYLSMLSSKDLSRILFPLGNLTKESVKEIAKSLGMEKVLKRRESMGICFVGKRNFSNFIQEYINTDVGDFVDENGKILGSHDGIQLFTIGQKARIGGQDLKLYVADKDPETNRILVVPKHHPLLETKIVEFEPFWIHHPPYKLDQLSIKYRYRMSPTFASIFKSNLTGYTIVFSEPQISVSPGQHITVYDDDEVLGGGPISGTFPRYPGKW